jgi:hypothetical protein
MSGIMLNVVGGSFAGLPKIGDAYGGGFFAGQISSAGNGIASYNLVVAPKSSGESSKQYKTTTTSTSGTDSVVDGQTNSSNMNDASHPAAQYCEGLTIGGFSDWYLPAKNELELLYFNLKPPSRNNATDSGANTNAVPSRASNYTAGNPGQTSVTAFQEDGTEALNTGSPYYYWASTQNSSSLAEAQSFYNGSQGQRTKTDSVDVRAVRRIAA